MQVEPVSNILTLFYVVHNNTEKLLPQMDDKMLAIMSRRGGEVTLVPDLEGEVGDVQIGRWTTGSRGGRGGVSPPASGHRCRRL